MKAKDFQKFLQDNNAGKPSVEWVAGRPLTLELIQACPDKNWLTWLSQRLPVDHPLLEELGKEENVYVRLAVAKRIPTDHPLLEELGKDSGWRVRAAVAKRIPTDHPLLKELGKDENAYVRETVARRMKENNND